MEKVVSRPTRWLYMLTIWCVSSGRTVHHEQRLRVGGLLCWLASSTLPEAGLQVQPEAGEGRALWISGLVWQMEWHDWGNHQWGKSLTMQRYLVHTPQKITPAPCSWRLWNERGLWPQEEKKNNNSKHFFSDCFCDRKIRVEMLRVKSEFPDWRQKSLCTSLVTQDDVKHC